MRIIDARFRPATPKFVKSTVGYSCIIPRFDQYWKWFGFESAGESVEKQDAELSVREMEEAGIDFGIIPCRWGASQSQEEPDIAPEDVFPFVDAHPGKFAVIIAASVDKPERALADAEKYCVHGKARGVNLEFVTDSPEYTLVSDKKLWPLYEYMQEKGLVLYITGGGFGGCQPVQEVGKVLTAFPHLSVVDAHAHVPDAIQACFMAFRHENYYLLPDLYVPNTFFDRIYYDAAKSMLQDQIVFGTAYPFGPLKGITDYYLQKWDLPDAIREKVMGGNIARVFGL